MYFLLTEQKGKSKEDTHILDQWNTNNRSISTDLDLNIRSWAEGEGTDHEHHYFFTQLDLDARFNSDELGFYKKRTGKESTIFISGPSLNL